MWKLSSGILLGWSLGANHTGNVFGTGVATGTVRYRTAVILTALFVFAGAAFEGPKCMETVSALSRLSSLDAFSCALAAGIIMTVLTFLAFPSSASQAVIGAVLGAGIFYGSADFTKLYKIVVCWLFTPFFAIFTSFAIYHLLSYFLERTVTSVTRRNVIYSVGTVLTGCYGAYSLGANNVANVTGIYVGSGDLSSESAALIGGLSIASGVLTFSKRVMMTIGKGIVPLDPFSALVSVLAASFTLHVFTQVGVPVSSSQSIVGAVVGIGLAGNLQTVNLDMLSKIGIGWISSPLTAAVLSYFFVKLRVAEFVFPLFFWL
ncbi:MAG: inorganic phosphate transporter [Syntrophobacteraceae bacterium]|nr:inorganic phosphate transporter [Syntrophobacteraceae bacterium]